MNKLNDLICRCKCGVSLTVNKHRNYYEKAAHYLSVCHETEEDGEGIYGCDPDTLATMIEMDTIVELQFYPETSISFYQIAHYDVEMAIDEALEVMDAHEHGQRERAG